MPVLEKHTDYPDIQEIKDLIALEGEPCVSLYVPTHAKGPDVRQDPIRLKNDLKEADEALAKEGLKSRDIQALLQPAWDLLDQGGDIWQYLQDTLAIFLGPDRFSLYRLPFTVEERVIVDRGFHMLPLLPVVFPDTRFWVLSLDLEGVHLYEATRHSLEEVELGEDVPKSLEEYRAGLQEISSLQFHTGAPRADEVGNRGAIFHGHGASNESTDKKDILQFFHHLNNGVTDKIEGERTPLLLAGQPQNQALYRETCHSSQLMEQGIDINPQDLSPKQLHDSAWEIVKPHTEKGEAAARERFLQMKGHGDTKALEKLDHAVPFAVNQRLDTLFVSDCHRAWGIYDPETNHAKIHPNRKKGDRELYNLCACKTLLYGGTVFVVSEEEIPGEGKLAAIVR
jgi:hypothetical protein